MLVEIERHLWTVEEYHSMVEAGILHSSDRVELIEGEIITMSPIGVRHMACVNRINELFTRHYRGKAIVSVQNPVRIGDHSEPEPDVVLFFYQDDFYATRQPTNEDVLLLVEVSDATIPYDRRVKRPLYAHANIPEYWIINLVDNSVEVHRNPQNGLYIETFTLYQGDVITAVAFPDSQIQIADIIS